MVLPTSSKRVFAVILKSVLLLASVNASKVSVSEGWLLFSVAVALPQNSVFIASRRRSIWLVIIDLIFVKLFALSGSKLAKVAESPSSGKFKSNNPVKSANVAVASTTVLKASKPPINLSCIAAVKVTLACVTVSLSFRPVNCSTLKPSERVAAPAAAANETVFGVALLSVTPIARLTALAILTELVSSEASRPILTVKASATSAKSSVSSPSPSDSTIVSAPQAEAKP